MIPRMRQALYADLGVRFPGVHVRTDSPILEKDEYSIHLNEVPIVRGKVLEGYVLTNESEENLNAITSLIQPIKTLLGLPSLWVEDKHKELLEKAGIKYWNTLEVMILAPLLLLPPLCQRIRGHPRSQVDAGIYGKILPRPCQRGDPFDPSAKNDRYFQTLDPRTDLHQRLAHNPGSLERMGANRKRYRSAD